MTIKYFLYISKNALHNNAYLVYEDVCTDAYIIYNGIYSHYIIRII